MSDRKFTPLEEHEDFEPDLRRAFEFADQNVDPALVDHSKVKMAKDSVLLSGDGAFYTLQGEGPTMGLPCVFVRLHVCNLRCTWCDAWYTWNPNTPEFWKEPHRKTFEEVAHKIVDTWAGPDTPNRKRVIFTGGEPLIQRKQLDEVIQLLHNQHNWSDGTERMLESWAVEFETNGTLMPTEYQLQYCQFNVSPKLKNSENRENAMVKPKVLSALDQANTTFKFVCYDETDLAEIEAAYLPHISEDKVIIMPQGIRSEEIDENMQKLYEPCMKRGWRLLGRMQSQFADGARRGV